jgi:hypothetical protein
VSAVWRWLDRLVPEVLTVVAGAAAWRFEASGDGFFVFVAVASGLLALRVTIER